MKSRLLSLTVLALIAASPVRAEISTQDALKDYDSGSKIVITYIQGLRQGLEWANAGNRHINQRPLYCPPPKLALSLQQYVSVLKDYMSKHPQLNEEPVGASLLMAAQDAFPCQQ
jgi:hypothetical protein